MNEPQQWVIDAIEEQVASIELPNGDMIHLPVALLPAGAKPGEILSVSLAVELAATQQARRASSAQTRKIADASRAIDPGGDVTL